MRRNAWIELDATAWRDNLTSAQQALSPGTQMILVVKANAYGHGMTAVAQRARDSGVSWFLVSRMDEAVELRDALPDVHILLLGAIWPADLDELTAFRITPVLVSEAQAAALAAEARQRGVTLGCHAKIDTGMGRFGFAWQDAAGALGRLKATGGLSIEGLATHFASAGQADDSFALSQAERFQRVLADCARLGLHGLFRHISNSAACAAHAAWDLDAVRLGIVMYGYGEPEAGTRLVTRPFLQWKTRVVQVKRVPAGFPVSYLGTHVTRAPTWLATVDVGYSDGYSRLLSSKGHVLVGGRRVPVAGRVTMNFLTVDVGPEGGVQAGDEVVLLGRQGGEAVWADELARWCGTIPYEILTSIRSDRRVWRE